MVLSRLHIYSIFWLILDLNWMSRRLLSLSIKQAFNMLHSLFQTQFSLHIFPSLFSLLPSLERMSFTIETTMHICLLQYINSCTHCMNQTNLLFVTEWETKDRYMEKHISTLLFHYFMSWNLIHSLYSFACVFPVVGCFVFCILVTDITSFVHYFNWIEKKMW